MDAVASVSIADIPDMAADLNIVVPGRFPGAKAKLSTGHAATGNVIVSLCATAVKGQHEPLRLRRRRVLAQSMTGTV
jgi:hypothetical protein